MVFDCRRATEDYDASDSVVTLRIRRAEVLLPDDRARWRSSRQSPRIAHRSRCPLDLEDEITSSPRDAEPDSPADPEEPEQPEQPPEDARRPPVATGPARAPVSTAAHGAAAEVRGLVPRLATRETYALPHNRGRRAARGRPAVKIELPVTVMMTGEM